MARFAKPEDVAALEAEEQHPHGGQEDMSEDEEGGELCVWVGVGRSCCAHALLEWTALPACSSALPELPAGILTRALCLTCSVPSALPCLQMASCLAAATRRRSRRQGKWSNRRGSLGQPKPAS